jgi:hypothetical protein
MPLDHLEPRQLSRYSDRLRAGTVGVRFSVGETDLFLLHSVHIGSGVHLAFYEMGTRGFSPAIRRPECEAYHSSVFSVEVKIG